MKKIVVGVDGSENASVAMRWATAEAGVHRARVEMILAWGFLDQHFADQSDRFDPNYTEGAARDALAAWVAETVGPDAGVEQRVVADTPARAVLEAGDSADLIVVGARGVGGFEGLLLGSVSERVAQQSTRPVAVVRAARPVVGGRVVVGVDGSAASIDALRWAAVEARARGAELDVVHAWRLPPMTPLPAVAMFNELSAMEDAGRAVLERAMAEPAMDGVDARPHLTSNRPAPALVAFAADANLLVVGSRGLGRVSGALLGSVSRQLLHHAACPVVVL